MSNIEQGISNVEVFLLAEGGSHTRQRCGLIRSNAQNLTWMCLLEAYMETGVLLNVPRRLNSSDISQIGKNLFAFVSSVHDKSCD